MIPIDFHMHSTHSMDGHGTVTEMCEAAVARGVRQIGFTEHLDFDRADPAYGFFDYEASGRAIEDARARFAGRLVIRRGLEFDFRREYGDEVGRVLGKWQFDYRIGSVHSAVGILLHRLNREGPPPGFDLRRVQEAYFDEVEALVASGWCTVLGHFDYLFKQLPTMVAPRRDEWYWGRVDRILAACIAGGVVPEVNMHHVLDLGQGMAMDSAVLARYLALGGLRLSVGGDAHRPADVGHAYDRAEAVLRDAGVTTLTGFDRGRPYDVPL
jgi:histidinol-phosphatase (PHP family)